MFTIKLKLRHNWSQIYEYTFGKQTESIYWNALQTTTLCVNLVESAYFDYLLQFLTIKRLSARMFRHIIISFRLPWDSLLGFEKNSLPFCQKGTLARADKLCIWHTFNLACYIIMYRLHFIVHTFSLKPVFL